MKQSTKGKNRKWIYLVVGAVLLIAAVAAASVLLIGQLAQWFQQPARVAGNGGELYWNLDRETYLDPETSLSSRDADADGIYRMRFAYKGQQVELPVADKQLVNYIDTMDVVALVLDADGVVVDAMEPKAIATELFRDGYMHKIEGNTLVANSSPAINGMAYRVPITENTGIYDVSADAEVVGASAQCEVMDTITVYADGEGNATHIYITKHPVKADVYWRVGRFYDVENQCTTRTPDKNGVYTLLFAKDGEQVELKCRDKAFVDRIDSFSPVMAQLALLFDEEGYLVDNANIAMALRGKQLCQYYTITDIEGDQVTVERIQTGTEQGTVKTFTMSQDCDIFMCCTGCYESHVGERTDHLRVGDTVNVYTDLDDKPILIYVSTRPVESKLYYNLAQQYNSTTKETKRVPENGWYVFELFCEGKTVKVKTKSKEIASSMDSMLVMGLALDGSVAQRTYATRCVSGTNSEANAKYVTSVMGTIFTAASVGSFDKPVNAVMNSDCQIYDMTGDYGTKKGDKTTLQPYDRIYAYSDIYNRISQIFVYSRYAEGTSVYYNVNRKYDSVKGVTTREPDAEGYYVYDLICNGKTVTAKTKSKEMATFIDAQSAPTVALRISGGIIKEAHFAQMAVKFGIKRDNYVYVDKVNKDGTYTTYYYSDDQKIPGAVARKIAKNCAIYNMSAVFADHRGEKTTLQPGDRIQAIVSDETGEAVMLFVLSRELDSPMYYHVARQYDTATGQTRRTPNEEGWYVFDLAVNGQIKQFKTKSKEVASEVDQFSAPFVMITDGDVILRACNATLHKDVKANAAGQYDVMAIKGNKVTLTRNRPLATNYGDTKELELAENYQVYDVSTYAENFGAKTTLKVGDRVTCYADDNGNVTFIFVHYASTRKAGPVSYCDYCQKDVFWNPYTGEIYETDAHYYLPCETQISKGKNIGSDTAKYAICLDLNGQTISSGARPFLIYSALSIMDSAGGGSVVGRCGSAINLGGCITVANGGELNLYDGTLTLQKGGIAPNKGGVVNVGYNAVFNMYGGAVKGGYAADQGGNIYVNGSTFNMYGGTVEGGTAAVSGGNIATATNSKLNLLGGTISGDAVVSAGSKVTVSGDLTVTAGALTGLRLSAGDVLTLGELTEKASIVISADGVFTEVKENIADYLPSFKPFKEEDTIAVQEGALAYVKAPVDLNKLNNSNLVFEEGTTQAICPVCQGKVTWTALTEKKANLTDGGHYYLAENVTYEGGSNWYLLAPASGTACVHLNGHNITSPTKAIQGNTGALNVMGNGTVTGGYTDAANPARGAVVDTTPSKADCAQVTAINLLGGTYVASQGNTQRNAVSVWDNGGRINLYAGAVVSGGVYVGNANILVGEFNMYGGTVEGCVSLGGSTKNACSFNLYGGTAAGANIAANSLVTVSGAPTVNAMTLAQGVKLTLGELTEGASITVAATGVFTEEKDNISDYAGFFHAAEGYRLETQGNALACISTAAPEPEQPEIPVIPSVKDDLELDADGYGVCPVCEKKVQWTSLNALSDSRLGFKNDKAAYEAGTPVSYHYYLSDDLAYAKNAQYAERYYNINCLHLNGHSLSYKSRMSIGIGATLNIMGTGSITGSCDSTTAANNTSVLYTYNSGVINLYSGTVNCTNSAVPAAMIGGNASTQINIFDGASVTGGVTANNGTVTISGDSDVDLLTIGTSAKLSVRADWTGTATANFAAQLKDNQVPAANGVCEDVYTGKLYLDAAGSPVLVGKDGRLTVSGSAYSQALELDADGYGMCPVCEEKVLWTSLNALSDSRLGFKNDKAAYEAGTPVSYHYYLSDDLAYTKNAQYAERYYNINCLHLNGHSLSYKSRMSIGIGATLNIMGTGSITGSCDSTTAANNTSVLYTYNSGVINLYGGGVNCTNSAVPAVMIGSHAPTQINIFDGASVTGGVKANNGTVTVSGDSDMDLITIGAAAKLTVSANWTGNAQVSFASQITDGVIPAKNGTSLGAYTGILTMDSKAVIGKDGALVIRTFDPDTDDGVLKILGIGNSYTQDSMHLLYEVYKAENPDKEIVLAFLYRGACSLNTHAAYLTNNTAAYTYYKLDSQTGTWQQVDNMTMRLGILDEQWDVVTMQQNSGNSTNAATYSSKIGTIRDYVEQTLGYKPAFGWNFTWGYPDDADLLNTSTTANFANDFFDTYGTTEEMYNRISAAVQEKIVNGSYSFDYLMPVGTAIQNARSNHLTAKELYRDSLHLNNLGRLIAAYTWYCELEGYNGADKALTELKLTKIPEALALTTSYSNGVTQLDAQLQEIVLESVNNAMKNKFAVTQSN